MNKKVKYFSMPLVMFSSVLASCNPGSGNPNITYTLDSDVVIRKINHDIEVVDTPDLPGKSIAHKDRRNGTFNILAFTDLHLDHYQEVCNYTFSMLARNIMNADPKPDLVVFCGDNITSSFNEGRTIQFAELLENLGVYWCAVLGNHEKNAENPNCIERDKMINIWCKYPHCLIDNSTKKLNSGETVWGIGNSLINLVSFNGVTQSLYFLDSGTEMTQEDMDEYADEIEWFIANGKAKVGDKYYYDYIKDSQVKWYLETFKKIKKQMKKEEKQEPRATVFTHVPLAEHEDAYLKFFNEYEEATEQKLQGISGGMNMRVFTDFPQTEEAHRTYHAKELNELYENPNGFLKGERMRRREGVCYGPHDIRYTLKGEHTPMFEALKETGNNNALFCGHDHSNNYVLKYDGVILGYIQAGCYSSNNLFTKGMLGKNPFKPEDKTDKYSDHLIQGYSQITYKNESDVGGEYNIINSFKQIDNYTTWKEKKPKIYERLITLLKKEYKRVKGKEYQDNHANYLDGNK